jgi:hypothetical protein
MRFSLALLTFAIAGTVWAGDLPKSRTLTPNEIADGWISLFDGVTTFGWKAGGEVAVKDGKLILGGPTRSGAIETTGVFGNGSLNIVSKSTSNKTTVSWRGMGDELSAGHGFVSDDQKREETPIRIVCPAGATLEVEAVLYKPKGLQSIFNGKDLTGWKRYTGDEKRAKSKFAVTPEGWINVKYGPGDLQTEKQWADFVFQGECISNGKALNSGVFFRCIPGQYQNGYEYQVHNGYKDNDRTKPADFGTGAIYRRVPARKVVPNDHEWFTMTLIAQGRHIRTWVNGYPTVDWTDERKENENARNGCKLGAGPISLQGHDPTTDLSFRNLRVAELKKD